MLYRPLFTITAVNYSNGNMTFSQCSVKDRAEEVLEELGDAVDDELRCGASRFIDNHITTLLVLIWIDFSLI